jgi:hypothetical protein
MLVTDFGPRAESIFAIATSTDSYFERGILNDFFQFLSYWIVIILNAINSTGTCPTALRQIINRFINFDSWGKWKSLRSRKARKRNGPVVVPLCSTGTSPTALRQIISRFINFNF